MTASERIREARGIRILGHGDNLGYLWCSKCKPVHAAMGDVHIVWSDQSAHVDEPCEMCHKPLNH